MKKNTLAWSGLFTGILLFSAPPAFAETVWGVVTGVAGDSFDLEVSSSDYDTDVSSLSVETDVDTQWDGLRSAADLRVGDKAQVVLKGRPQGSSAHAKSLAKVSIIPERPVGPRNSLGGVVPGTFSKTSPSNTSSQSDLEP